MGWLPQRPALIASACLDAPPEADDHDRAMDRESACRVRVWLAVCAAGVVFAALLAAGSPARAATATFGADLVGPANNTATCATVNWFPGRRSTLVHVLLGRSRSELLRAGERDGDHRPGEDRPADGSDAGRRAVFALPEQPADPGHPYFACCYVAQYGPVFTPAANAVTPITTSLSMVEQPTPPPGDGQSIAEGDFLAISVLNAKTPIPGHRGQQQLLHRLRARPEPAERAASWPQPTPGPGLDRGKRGPHRDERGSHHRGGAVDRRLPPLPPARRERQPGSCGRSPSIPPEASCWATRG